VLSDEIRRDPALRAFGVVLAALQGVAFLHWQLVQPAALLISDAGPPLCWPFFEDCHRFRVLSPSLANGVIILDCVLGLSSGALFLRERTVRAAVWLLCAATALQAAILFHDYRLRLNQHYMVFWATFVFLFLPDKRRLLRCLVVAFYFWAGTLKIDPDWLSGAALQGRKPLLLPDVLLVPSLWYVLALELVVCFGLLSSRRWLRWGALIQLWLFHLASFGIVGFFYPLLMLGLLSIFPLTWRVTEPERERPTDLEWLGSGRARSAYLLLGVFSAFQLVPFAFPGDSKLTGEGRLFALHMFDARIDCRGSVRLKDTKGGLRELAIRAERAPVRIGCDPIVYFGIARALCRELGRRHDFSDLDLLLRSRHSRDPTYTDVVDIADFCRSDTTYDLYRHNAWIRTN
jgi:hypothetical protein